jgi:hypothetical protein
MSLFDMELSNCAARVRYERRLMPYKDLQRVLGYSTHPATLYPKDNADLSLPLILDDNPDVWNPLQRNNVIRIPSVSQHTFHSVIDAELLLYRNYQKAGKLWEMRTPIET